jgi:hypothetical protein
MSAKTVGFAIADSDRIVLDRLTEHFADGNRSEFLRIAMKRMEHDRIAEKLIQTQARIRSDMQGRVLSDAEVLALIERVSADK